MNEETERKVRGIVGLYSFYKTQMTTPQRIALLTLWIEACLNKEEYEVANALQKEMDRIIKGEEEYVLIAPTNIFGVREFIPPTMDEMKSTVINNIENPTPKRKKLKFVNYWGTGKFYVFKLKFGDFKFLFLNIGFEMK